ncbi:translin-associated protein X [Uranotaenia lowii]|uniref:translin-associated protein X n=1 Tax=Uranotaenia lowii TaxID=190385 RepID=UPI0024796BCF|nr:translin-associated protein X [Uranotaenia lowii]
MGHREGNRRGNNNFWNNKSGGGHRQGGGGSGAGKRNNAASADSPLAQCFLEYASELDDKHDRYERILKCSRDITIESKRIIFLLHTVDAKKDNKERVCVEAFRRLKSLCDNNFLIIAKELDGRDPYQYSRAYTAGLQEFIEAYTFYEYVFSKTFSHWKSIQKELCFKVRSNEENSDAVESDLSDEKELACLLSPLDYILGIGDLTGEVMRKSINSLGSGDINSCFEHCRFLQMLYKGFVSLSNVRSRDFSQKLHTLQQSMLKIEAVCYNVKVRGGEATKLGITDSASFGAILKNNVEDDEGVFF